jgi:hypothetical protein
MHLLIKPAQVFKVDQFTQKKTLASSSCQETDLQRDLLGYAEGMDYDSQDPSGTLKCDETRAH